MTDANLMDADCIHATTWWECPTCQAMTAVLDAWDELIPVIEADLRPHPQAAALYSALNRLAELEGRRNP